MPLVWAHAEYIKLLVSRQLGHPFDRPHAAWQRYAGNRPEVQHDVWLPQAPIREIRAGHAVLVGLFASGTVHWGLDGWQSIRDTSTQDTGLGLHLAELESGNLHPGQRIDFTFRDADTGEWSGRDYAITVTR